MDVGKSFTYVFDDEQWLSKVLMGALFSLLSIFLVGIPFVVGYAVEVVANVRKGVERPLPAWDNLGDKFRDGLLLSIGFLVYMLPFLIIYCPYIFLAAVSGDGSAARDALGLLSLCLLCLALVWAIIVSLLSPAIYIRFAQTRELGSIFRFSDIIGFTTKNLGPVIVAILLAWVAAIVGSLVGLLLCGIGVFVTSFWVMLVESHLFGQIGLEGPALQAPEVTPA